MLLNSPRDLGIWDGTLWEGPAGSLLAVIDDDSLFLAVLAANLTAAGYEVATFTAYDTLLSEVRAGLGPRAVLCGHVAMIHHTQSTNALRTAGFEGPVVRLTAEVSAIQPGEASLSLIRTLPPVVTVHHLQRLLSTATSNQGTFVLGDLRLQMAWQEAFWREKPLRLRRADFAVVSLLAARAGTTVPYRDLYDAIRSDLLPEGARDTYRVQVRGAVERVRRRFTARDSRFEAIAHDAGLGYRWRL